MVKHFRGPLLLADLAPAMPVSRSAPWFHSLIFPCDVDEHHRVVHVVQQLGLEGTSIVGGAACEGMQFSSQ